MERWEGGGEGKGRGRGGGRGSGGEGEEVDLPAESFLVLCHSNEEVLMVDRLFLQTREFEFSF